MSQKTFSWITGILFSIIAAFHLIRSIIGAPITVGDWVVPVGVSVVFFLITAFLAYSAFHIDSGAPRA